MISTRYRRRRDAPRGPGRKRGGGGKPGGCSLRRGRGRGRGGKKAEESPEPAPHICRRPKGWAGLSAVLGRDRARCFPPRPR
ncbi:FAM57A isoform 5 [Pongo abelii]|nr:FAM57A isoform 5 [Pongo abelii]